MVLVLMAEAATVIFKNYTLGVRGVTINVTYGTKPVSLRYLDGLEGSSFDKRQVQIPEEQDYRSKYFLVSLENDL